MNSLSGHIILCGLLLYLCPVSECSRRIVYGFVGHSVTLPCRYNAGYYGVLHMCWGRGYIPKSGCNNEIVSTNGETVTYRKSYRYQFLGRLNTGDVSLTIKDTVGSDAGIYGCRVQIPGWFNDQKDTVHLILKTAPVTTTQIPVTINRKSSRSPAQEPTTTQAPVTTERVSTEGPTVITTDFPVPSDWPTDPETTDTMTTDAFTQVLPHVQSTHVATAEATVSPHWLTDPETKQKATNNIHEHERPPPSPLPTDAETRATLTTQIITTDLPVPSDWPTDPETTDTMTTDAFTQVLPHVQSTHVATAEATVSPHWLTDPETKQKATNNIHEHERPPPSPLPTDAETRATLTTQIITTDLPVPSDWPTDPETTDTMTTDAFTQDEWDYFTASLTLGQTPGKSTTSAEKALMLRPYLPWILGAVLLLVAVFVTAIIFQRNRHKAGGFKLPQQTSSSALLVTSDPILELENTKVEMKMENVVQLEEGDNSERCP
ncbi:hypothetical protein SKAU_G00424570 [Synaphobranchus kaupii]|uniref:Ig-like domain-containing protein n=1 Tax=Synaphobranchus kaupii TaxID=118154 RepID=A0A9Q1I8S0_SYNKA|nr:hypothetical protein SKAU_G00424570 [Synaphobranchus kaupii]